MSIYLEAHGTGTPLGDPIELNSVLSTMCPPSRAAPLVVGSVKTNIGHAEAAAGVAGLIKTVLSMNNNTIPRHLHLSALNPHLPDFSNKISVPSAGPILWNSYPKIAAVNSFGFSGTNATVILEQFHQQQTTAHSSTTALRFVPLSAKSGTALRATAAKFKELLLSTTIQDLDSISFTSIVARSHFAHRLALVGTSTDDLVKGINNYLATPVVHGQKSAPEVVFVFGSNYTESIDFTNNKTDLGAAYTTTITDCKNILSQHGDIPELLRIRVTLFAQQVALAAMWKSWEVVPSVCVGCGIIGQCAAAVVAGTLSLVDAIELLLDTKNTIIQASPHLIMIEETPSRSVLASNIMQVCTTEVEILEFSANLGAIQVRPSLESVITAASTLYPERESITWSLVANTNSVNNFDVNRYERGSSWNWQIFATQLLPNANKTILPNYQFQRKRYWFDARNQQKTAHVATAKDTFASPLLQKLDIPGRFYFSGKVDTSKYAPHSQKGAVPLEFIVAIVNDAWTQFNSNRVPSGTVIENMEFNTEVPLITTMEVDINVEIGLLSYNEHISSTFQVCLKYFRNQ